MPVNMSLQSLKPSRSERNPQCSRSTVIIGTKSLDAILAELGPEAHADQIPENAFCARQAATAWGMTDKGARNRINKLLTDGRIASAGRFRKKGVNVAVEFYTLIDNQKASG